MNLTRLALRQQRMILSIVFLLCVAGLAAWFGMNRQEDPTFPYRGGHVRVSWAGADADQMERLVVNPLEEEITQVEDIKEIRTTIRSGFANLVIQLKDRVYDTETAWDRVRAAMARAEPLLPEGVETPVLDDKQVDASTVVLAVTGSDDLVELQAAAERLKKRLFSLPEVARIRVYGDNSEQLSIDYPASRAAALKLSPEALATQLSSRNQVLSAGHLDLADRRLLLLPDIEFNSLQELENTPILLGNQQTVPLGSIAGVRLEVSDPPQELIYLDGRPAVAVALIVSHDQLNVVRFGETLRQTIAGLADEFAPLKIEEMFFQPDRVRDRLSELGQSLLLGVGIVAVLLLLTMGARMGLVVASIVPLVALSSLAIAAMGGSVMHQMSVAGMIIALGMLVDNAIVMVENIQYHLDRGASRMEAAVTSVRELAAPLGAATGTTLAVFIPMLVSRGNTADFTRAIPAMIILMLVISYAYALFVTPLVSRLMLRARPSLEAGPERSKPATMQRLGNRVGSLAVRHPLLVVGVAAGLMLLAVGASRWVDRDFFPPTDRNQLVVDVLLPEGTPIGQTRRQVLALAAELAGREGVTRVMSFIGSSGPRFFYNLAETPRAPHVGRLVLVSENAAQVGPLMQDVAELAPRWPEAELVARRLAQGPPSAAPVELELTGSDREQLYLSARRLVQVLNGIPGTRDVRHDQGIGLPALEMRILDAAADAAGLDRPAIARSLAMQSQGQVIGQYRAGDDPIPIRLRTPPEGQHSVLTADRLGASLAFAADGTATPLDQVTRQDLRWRPAVLHHYNLQAAVNVLSELEDGATYVTVLQAVEEALADEPLPAGVTLHTGGLAESSGEANTALFQTLPLGAGVLLLFLMAQFNSFRRVGIVLITVPLAAIGVIPGLLLTGNSFGFMALLGVIALVGIVVNNAIVLVDVIDRNLSAGLGRDEAIVEAVARRTRPILLTMLTTVAGLVPLTVSSSTLWPPLAWSIISGLLAATVLTLGVIPSLCHWLLPANGKTGAA